MTCLLLDAPQYLACLEAGALCEKFQCVKVKYIMHVLNIRKQRKIQTTQGQIPLNPHSHGPRVLPVKGADGSEKKNVG